MKKHFVHMSGAVSTANICHCSGHFWILWHCDVVSYNETCQLQVYYTFFWKFFYWHVFMCHGTCLFL